MISKETWQTISYGISIENTIKFTKSGFSVKDPLLIKLQIISIFHGYAVRTEISVSRVTGRHHEALPTDAKAWPERRKLLSVLNNYDRHFFLHTIYLFMSCNKMHTVCKFCHYSSQVDTICTCVLLQPMLIEPRHKHSIIAFEEWN